MQTKTDIILDAVAEVTGVEKERIIGKARFRYIVDARKIAIHEMLRAGARVGEASIALNRTHCSIIYHRREYEALCEYSKGYARIAQAVHERVNERLKQFENGNL